MKTVIFLWQQPKEEMEYRQRYGLVNGHFNRLSDDLSTNFACLGAWCQIRTPGLVLIRRSAFAQIGTFDATMVPSEDWDFWLRLTRHSGIIYVNRALTYYRHHDANATLNIARMNAAALRVRQKTYRAPQNTPEQREILKAVFQAGHQHLMKSKFHYVKQHLRRGEMRAAGQQLAYAGKHFLRSVAPLRFG